LSSSIERSMIKIGISGAYNKTKAHLRSLKENPLFEISGFTGGDMAAARSMIKEFNIPYYSTFDELLKNSDAIDFTVPHTFYFDQVSKAVRHSKHVFLSNPYTLQPGEFKAINNLLKEANVVAQIGYTERFNPAYLSACKYISNPTFIDTARLVQYSSQNSQLSVINDLMIKDIDIVLSFIKSNVKKVSANAVSIVNENPDMVSARIEFDNGSIANLTAGRVSEMNIRKARVYQNNSYVFIDFYEKWVKLSAKGDKQLDFEDVKADLTTSEQDQTGPF
jgi:predicted dehydrogenase